MGTLQEGPKAKARKLTWIHTPSYFPVLFHFEEHIECLTFPK